jgi:putative PIN family toxin of toxin-antitoxin system
MRIVLDPSVVGAAAISRGGPNRRLLVEFRSGAFDLVMCPRLLDEIDRLLNRPRLRRHLSAADAEGIVELLRRESVTLDDPPPPDRPLSDDPADDYLLALARAGSASAVVANDPHLIALGGPFPILTPGQFLLTLS